MANPLFPWAGNRLILALSLVFFLAPSGRAQDEPAGTPPPTQAAQPAPAPKAAEPAAPSYPQPATPLAQAIQALLKAGVAPKQPKGASPNFQAQLEALYQPSGYAPLWIQAGKTIPQAQKAIASMATADDDGLDAADYQADALGERLRALNAQASPSPQELAAFDTALSFALMRYASNLYQGRINPKQVNFNLDIEPKKQDLPALLRKIAKADKPDALLADLEPKLKLYGYLKNALAHYRQLAKDAPADPIVLPAKFKPGNQSPEVLKVRKRLAVSGDLADADANDTSPVYDKTLAEAVKHFQSRHGLTADAVIGKGTLAQFNVPLADRIKQIQLGMERLRWLPEQIDGRYIIVNIPSFQLFGFHDGSQEERADLVMNVIVGEVIDGHNTPVFHSDMTYVNFRPYWNVPPSIARKEYVPILSRNPGYLGSHNMEIVSSYAPNAAVYSASPGNIQQLASGALRLRQKPGPKNALGLVKFAFPNTNNVYLHSTPSQSLFKRTRRDFSHGCIRVEYPVKLAEFVLKDHAEWTRDKLEAAMQAGQPKCVTLKTPIPVYIFYSTVLADADGHTMFFNDWYGHDKILGEQLAKGFPYAP